MYIFSNTKLYAYYTKGIVSSFIIIVKRFEKQECSDHLHSYKPLNLYNQYTFEQLSRTKVPSCLMKSVAQGDMGKPNDQVKPGSTLASVFPPMTKSNQVKIGGLYYPQKKQHTLKFECVGFLGLQQYVLKSGRQAKRLAKSLLWTSTRF